MLLSLNAAAQDLDKLIASRATIPLETRPNRCASKAKAALAKSTKAITTHRAAVELDGPNGSGRYWSVAIAIDAQPTPLTACLDETTIGHRWSHQVPLPKWEPLQDDHLVLWTSAPVSGEPLPSVLAPLVYGLDGGTLELDLPATRAMTLDFAQRYEGCDASDCGVLHAAAKKFRAWATPPPPPTVTDVGVPTELRALTSQLELSGLEWVPELKRYLALSDDTGLPDTPSRDSPWLFTLDDTGHVDAKPLAITGVDKISDLESIRRAKDGTFWLVTSHSLTMKGKAKSERRKLLHLELRDGKLTVKREVDLNAHGLEQLAGTPVDIEAVAPLGNQVLLGLKSPVSERHEAKILSFDGEKLTPWTTLILEVPGPDGTLVGEGVTDLLQLPDGRWLLAANAPKNGKPDGGGAVWLLDTPGATPKLLHRYLGLKPEGLSLSPDGKDIVVVFDRGEAQPQWTRWPIP
ncbi:MAG: esterase-like activity of phytase family protein [Myxococcaceae bacterium]